MAVPVAVIMAVPVKLVIVVAVIIIAMVGAHFMPRRCCKTVHSRVGVVVDDSSNSARHFSAAASACEGISVRVAFVFFSIAVSSIKTAIVAGVLLRTGRYAGGTLPTNVTVRVAALLDEGGRRPR